jgi:hypothetical protein
MTTRDELLRQRCSESDWEQWQSRARLDEVWAQTKAHKRRVEASMRALEVFVSGGPGYIGISWGKDSCAVLMLAMRLGIDWPLVHVAIEPVANPDCAVTRDAWLSKYPSLASRYHEIVVRCQTKASTQRYDTNAAYEDGFATAVRLFGVRRVSGVRAEEAGIRKLTIRRNGLGDEDSVSARPIGYWKSEDVFAFVQDEFLSPAYPCTFSGGYERGRVRMNNLWGLYGEGFGRREWERRYYGDTIRDIEQQHARDLVEPPTTDELAPRVYSWAARQPPTSSPHDAAPR